MRKASGRRPGRAPYGYRYVDGSWLIVPQEATIVQRIYSEFTRTYLRVALSEIARDLNIEGVDTARGGRWHASTIWAILRNPVYCGEDMPAIITVATWDAAQRRLRTLRPGPA